jgi:hypothetical protein
MPLLLRTLPDRRGAAKENQMKLAWFVVAIAALAIAAVDGAQARTKHQRAGAQCVDQPLRFSWWGFLTNPPPEPNGCAPPVYVGGDYVGQDPDPYIRLQLSRDPATGYHPGNYF